MDYAIANPSYIYI